MDAKLDLKWRRKALQIRTTLYVAIPIQYAEAAKIAKGTYLEIRVGQDGSINVRKELETNA